MKEKAVRSEMKPVTRDFRATWAIVFVLSLMILDFSRSTDFSKDIFKHSYMYLKTNNNNLLYLEGGSTAGSRPLPPSFSPLFFAPVPINQADQQLLQTIPGIGPVMAGKIVQWREAHGPLHDVGDLLAIPGIGKKRAAAWADHLSFVTSE